MKTLLFTCFAALLSTCAIADSRAAVRAATSGEAALHDGEYAKAVEWFNKAIQEDDTNPSFYGNRGSAYSYLGKLDEALRDYDTAIQKATALTGNPKDKRIAYFLYNRAFAYENAGRTLEALAEYAKTIELDPSYPDAHGNVAWILATHPDKAIRNSQKALEYALIEVKRTRMEIAGPLDTLAAAYAAEGRFTDACRAQKLAIAKALLPQDKREFSERLQIYEQNKPYIAPAK
ncbi:MAG TPA: tetratricopeptide repeat protein [Chthoniobacter sp.]|nr:tetratricopeptide repeat protein [Chthoniobacter sp.]